jgi:hypothetical protein
MKDRRLIFLPVLIIIAGAFVLWDVVSHRDYIDAFSGATPLALEKKVPNGLSIVVDGKVKQTYHFNSRSFRLLAKTRVRTREVTPGGEIMGAYIYTGVPVIHILEGVAPVKTKSDAFDRPLDMMVIFTSAAGKKAYFSYGELTMIDDSLPVMLAFHREPVLPSKDPESYSMNKYRENPAGLRLVCPREPDTSRYLDDVTHITLETPDYPDHLLPPMQKGKNCTSTSITCIENENLQPASFEGVPIIEASHWFRIGHGRGIKDDHTFTASGFHLRSFLKRNFPGCGPEDFFLFTACDGYRSLFSGKEIFCTDAGDSFMLLQTMDGKPPKGGQTLGPISDFFVDRNVRGLTHIVRFNASGGQGGSF